MATISDVVRRYLSAPRFAVLATIQADGTPHQSVIWYLLEGNELVMNTAVGRIKDQNIRRDPRISVCIPNEYAFVTISGRARLVEDQRTAQADIHRLAVRYVGEEAGKRQSEEMYAHERRVTIRLALEHVITHGIEQA